MAIDYDNLPTNIAVIGSRSFTKNWIGKQKVFTHVDTFVSRTKPDTVVVSGGARGVDTWAEMAAKKYNRRFIAFLPDKNVGIPQRFFQRNSKLVDHVKEHGGVVMAFIDVDDCDGTTNAILYARRHDVPVRVFTFSIDGTYQGETDGSGL